jgi:hypothetical protein
MVDGPIRNPLALIVFDLFCMLIFILIICSWFSSCLMLYFTDLCLIFLILCLMFPSGFQNLSQLASINYDLTKGWKDDPSTNSSA